MIHKARRRFGQNFLIDLYVIDKILNALNAKPDQLVVEIGPGLGAMTKPLLKLMPLLHVIEIDRDLVNRLSLECGNTDGLRIHNDDVLNFDFHQIASNHQKIRLIGNLPYNISTPLLFHVLQQRSIIQDMHFMLQREVVERMVAEPGSKTYGRLSIMLQVFCTAEKLFDVTPESFRPQPKVHSSIVRIKPLPQSRLLSVNEKNFSQLVANAFSQRRKTLRNSLNGLLTSVQIESVGIDPGIRAERLTIDQFILLSNLMSNGIDNECSN